MSELYYKVTKIFGKKYAIAYLSNGELAYKPATEDLTEAILQQHLDGKLTVACYQIQNNEYVHWLGWDVDTRENIDSAKNLVLKLSEFLTSSDIPHHVEFSGRKGYHVFILLDQLISAYVAKLFVNSVRDRLGLPKSGHTHVEAFPKQAKIREHKSGSAIKLPCGLHPVSRKFSFFVDFPNWDNVKEFRTVLEETCPAEKILKFLDAHISQHEELLQSIAEEWQAGTRHEFALALAGFCRKSGWEEDEVIDLVTEICKIAGDEELENRISCIQDTYRKDLSEPLLGLSKLREILSAELQDKLINFILAHKTEHQKYVESILNSRIPVHQKVEVITQYIWNFLLDGGLFLRTAEYLSLWLDYNNRKTITLDSFEWKAFIHGIFRIIEENSIGKQTLAKIRNQVFSSAMVTEAYRLAHWDGENLFVNFGEKVYILDGTSIEVSYNGECGKFFITKDQPDLRGITLTKVEPLDAWELLTDDLNYIKSVHAPASKEEQQQILRTWILSVFFHELLPTRPILTVIGAPGSGKTTAIRRILKLLEGLDEDLLQPVWDKPDAFRTSLVNHRILAWDNMERVPLQFLVLLEQLATGSKIELRKLYRDLDTVVIKPSCFPVLTAIEINTSQETFFDRILPLELERIEQFVPESEMMRPLREKRANYLADLLIKLNQTVFSIKQNSEKIFTTTLRMADFAAFASKLSCVDGIQAEKAIAGVSAVGDRQLDMLVDRSPLQHIFLDWVETYPEEASQWMTMGELHSHLSTFARIRGRKDFVWSSVMKFAPHFNFMLSKFRKYVKVEESYVQSKRIKKPQHVFRFWKIDLGDDA